MLLSASEVAVMRRKLTPDEKLQIMTERYAIESAAFAGMNIEVIVDDYTWANGEPNARVVHHSRRAEQTECHADPRAKASRRRDRVMRIVTGQEADVILEDGKGPAAKALGAKGGRKRLKHNAGTSSSA
jgi:hypothetical protein